MNNQTNKMAQELNAVPLLVSSPKIPGICWLLAFVLLQTGMALCVHALLTTHQADLIWVVWIRFVIGMLLILIPALFGYWSIKIHNKSAFIGRGLFGAGSMLAYFLVLQMIGVGRGSILCSLAGLFACIFAIPLLKEWPRPLVIVAIILATAGVMLSSQSGVPQGWEWLTILCAILGGLTFPFIRKLRQTDSNQVVFLSQCVFGFVAMLPLLELSSFPMTQTIWMLMLAMMSCDIISQFCLSQGFATVSVARGSTLLLLAPVFCLVAGVSFLDETLNHRQWIGCAAVLAAGFVVILSREKK
ncbi:MAG: DMT family transporter [Planctomycetes bacterium]|nr:DMT family transporter [Planctomycetota bacterium]